MEWYHVYLFTRLDGVKDLCSGLLWGIGLVAILALCMYPVAAELIEIEHVPFFKLGAKIAVVTLVISLIGSIAIPTQKEAAAIYLLPKLAKSDFAKEAGQIPTDAAKLMRLKLESWIADMELAKK